MATLQLYRNADSTITVRYGRSVEHISTDGKSPMQLLDAVRWAAITFGANVEEDHMWTMIQDTWNQANQ